MTPFTLIVGLVALVVLGVLVGVWLIKLTIKNQMVKVRTEYAELVRFCWDQAQEIDKCMTEISDLRDIVRQTPEGEARVKGVARTPLERDKNYLVNRLTVLTPYIIATDGIRE